MKASGKSVEELINREKVIAAQSELLEVLEQTTLNDHEKVVALQSATTFLDTKMSREVLVKALFKTLNK